MKNERALQARCLKWAREQGVWCRKTETPNFRGFPDVMCLYNGQVLFVEFKHPNGKGKLHPLQIKDHERLAEVGHEVQIIDSLDGWQELINEFLELGHA